MIGELDPKVVALELKPNYGKFSIEPLERGFGHTLGNAFRRVLLAHIPGAAVTRIHVEGVRHEFSTIENVVEDVTEIVLNLKELAVKVVEHEPEEEAEEDQEDDEGETEQQPEGEGERVLRISASGKTEVLGADVIVPEDVEILNPELHIAELSSPDAELEIEVWVETGKGYVPVEERSDGQRDEGIIPVDANFSPIRRVTYKVEPTRLGRRMDLDRLILELHGDSTVSPEEAIELAAKTLRQYMAIFLGEVEEEEELLEAAEEEEDEVSQWLRTPIEDIDFSVRTFNCLKKESINTLGDLIEKTEEDLLDIRNFGERSLEEVVKKLQQFDLALAEPEQ